MNIYTELSSYNKDHYLNRYIKLIGYYTENPPSVNYEVHHILPKSLFEDHKDNPNNLVKLPIRAHFIAHYLLHKIIGSKMTVAYFMMCNRLGKQTSKSYESARLYHIENMKGNNLSNIAERNPNHDGKQAKRAWANASEERRKKQSVVCANNNRIHKSKPKENRTYNCSWCGSDVKKLEFVHHTPKEHYYCNASCRNSRTNTIRKLKTDRL